MQVHYLGDDPADVVSLLQPHTAFTRLLAKCDRMELRQLDLRIDPASVRLGAETAAVAAALQAVASAMGGGLPDQLRVRGSSWDWDCTLQVRPRCQQRRGEDGGGVGAADGRGASVDTDGAATAAPAALMELTAEQVLEQAADKIWAAASGQGAADCDMRFKSVLLRGPFVWQLTCAPGAGGGARLLTDWLGSLVAAGPPLPPGLDVAAGAAGVKVRNCSFAASGSGTALAVVTCDCPFAALQLHRAATAAAARKTPGCLQVSAARAGDTDRWSSASAEVIRELWDDHLSSGPQPAADVAHAAAAGTVAGADGTTGGGGGGGGGGPAKTNAAGACGSGVHLELDKA
ncbi:hypothetical protein HXX76_011381 [Chlamydomonas incerta]|uniref:Uncharacterized protein n=1 Tax=Chlamydomonas incerta TaxID=51695 RepID=A0A835SZC6_CHLIN|nr:hypothetical protein HXX76_011381 [Chlamydomonas incerta]|eukprot:KAG2428676.1 hypothetical protein HXX76_011381 [Chlamydomonas incerta]